MGSACAKGTNAPQLPKGKGKKRGGSRSDLPLSSATDEPSGKKGGGREDPSLDTHGQTSGSEHAMASPPQKSQVVAAKTSEPIAPP